MDGQIFFSTGRCVLGDLRQRFPHDKVHEANVGLEALVSEVASFLAAPLTRLELPLDMRGSALEMRVWNALRDIPPGTTESYSDAARRVGSLGGYRWGVRRKRALLERERAG
jgi:AraC family transcriptional regulator, regulatory protein of adaptative response / methylated-DNA-[protein]-cysteine methyltransferase